MEFLIVIVVAAMIVGLFTQDDTKPKMTARECLMERFRGLCKEFYEKYSVSSEEYQEVRRRVQKIDADSEVLAIREELQEVMGCKPTSTAQAFALLAKKGKVPDKLHLFENTYGGDGSLSFSPLLSEGRSGIPNFITRDDVSPAERWGARYKFCLWYDKVLRENGMNHRLMFCDNRGDHAYSEPWGWYYHFKFRRPLTERNPEDDLEKIQFVAFWDPVAFDTPNVSTYPEHVTFDMLKPLIWGERPM